MRRAAKNLLKVAAAGATIAAIGFAVLAFGPRGEVRDTEADVLDFDFFETTPSARFAAALDMLGHEEPRVYRVGEETVYFSARPTDRTPAELVEEYQRAFVSHGINARPHFVPVSPASPSARAMLQGEVLTFAANEELMTMGGGSLVGLPSTQAEVSEVVRKNRKRPFEQVFRGFRSVRAERLDGKTLVTAVWSHDDFDFGAASSAGPPDAEVPACPGCTVMPAFETVRGDLDRTVYHLASPEGEADVHAFYRRALTDRGWNESPVSRQFDGELREYERGERRLTVGVNPVDGGSMVTLVRGD